MTFYSQIQGTGSRSEVFSYKFLVKYSLILTYELDIEALACTQCLRLRLTSIRFWSQDMPYASAIFLADLPTMSDRRDQLARKFFKSAIHPTSSLHNLLPLRGNIHLSLDYGSPQNFLASPLELKNTNHSSQLLSPTIKLHNCFFQFIYCYVRQLCWST